MVFLGLDLHKRYITGCAVGADSQILGEVRRVDPDRDAAGVEAGARARRGPLRATATREGQAEGDRRGGAEVLHVPVLDSEGGTHIFGLASPA